jgi:hypothetical protein
LQRARLSPDAVVGSVKHPKLVHPTEGFDDDGEHVGACGGVIHRGGLGRRRGLVGGKHIATLNLMHPQRRPQGCQKVSAAAGNDVCGSGRLMKASGARSP